jgi:hypothetical protein
MQLNKNKFVIICGWVLLFSLAIILSNNFLYYLSRSNSTISSDNTSLIVWGGGFKYPMKIYSFSKGDRVLVEYRGVNDKYYFVSYYFNTQKKPLYGWIEQSDAILDQ